MIAAASSHVRSRLRAVPVLALLWASLPAPVAGQADPAGEAFFDSDGVRIRYLERGAGEPVVLLHGYTESAERHFVDSGV